MSAAAVNNEGFVAGRLFGFTGHKLFERDVDLVGCIDHAVFVDFFLRADIHDEQGKIDLSGKST